MKDEETDEAPERGGGPRAMSRVLALLELLAHAPEGLSLTDLSTGLNTAKSTLLASLKPLAAEDFLIAEGLLYRLGPRAFRLAAGISAAWSLPRIVRSYMRELAVYTGESVGLGVLDEEMRRFVYIDVIESVYPVRYAMKIGLSGPLYATAAGRVLLAWQPEAYRETYFAKAKLTRFTDRTVTDAAQLRAQLEAVRDAGWWASVGELIEDSAAIAAPIFGPAGRIVAVLSVGAPADRLNVHMDRYAAALKEAAAHASGRVAAE